MKSSSKRLLSVLIVLAMALSMLPVMAFAADTTLYVKPNANWNQSGARFAAYFFGNGEKWLDCSDADGDGIYEVVAPEGYGNVIFCRMNPNNKTNNWNNKWNQTSDLKVPTDSKVCYVVAENTWDKGAGQWVEYTPEGGAGETEPTTASPIKYSVAGVATLCGSGWDPSDINNMMTDDDNDGIYTITYKNVAAGTYEFKVTDGTWSQSWGQANSDANYKLTVADADTTVEIRFDTNTKLVEVVLNGVAPSAPSTQPTVPGEAAYYVAGSFNSWTNPDANYLMTANEDGTYSLSINVTAGPIELKVTNGTWDDGCNWGDNGGNVVKTAATDGTIVVTFDPAAGTVTVTGDCLGESGEQEKTELVINSVHAVGAEGLTGAEWDPTANEMTGVDGIYTITFENVAAGTYEFKFAANGAWDINWASGVAMESGVVYDAWFNAMGNSSVTVPDGATVILTLDLSAMDAFTGEGGKCSVEIPGVEPGPGPEPTPATYYVAGGFNEWNCAAEGYLMTDNGDGTYTLVLNLTAGAYSLKVTNGTWDQSWGGAGADGNYEFTIAEDRAVTVTFDGTTVSVDGDVLPELPKEYCLVGYINGANYGCDEDWENVGQYLFVDGTLTATFTADSYIFVKTTDNANWYLTEAYTEETSATFIKNASEKMKVPGNVELTFTLVENEDGTLSVSYVAASEPVLGATVSGTVVSGANGDVTIELIADGEVFASVTATGKEGSYSIVDVAAGTYTLKVSQLNHVTREYAITVEADLTQDVKIHLIGDIDGNGKINVGDVSKLNGHMKGNLLTDEYMLLCANVNGGKLNMGDVSSIYAHIKGTKKLF